MGEVLVGIFLAPFLFGSTTGRSRTWRSCDGRRARSSRPCPRLVGDFRYWLNHLAGHRVGVYWAVHGVHHQSDEFNLAVALRHPWFSQGCCVAVLCAAPAARRAARALLHRDLSDQLLRALDSLAHLRVERALGVRHAAHAPASPFDEQAVLGLEPRSDVHLLGSLVRDLSRARRRRPARLRNAPRIPHAQRRAAQWILWRDLFRAASKSASWREKLKVFFGPPGYMPPGVKLDPEPRARDDREVPRAGTCAQFTVASIFALWVLWLRDRHTWALHTISTLRLLCTLGTLGALLDGTRNARRWEIVRVSMTLPAVLAWASLGFVGALKPLLSLDRPLSLSAMITARVLGNWLSRQPRRQRPLSRPFAARAERVATRRCSSGRDAALDVLGSRRHGYPRRCLGDGDEHRARRAHRLVPRAGERP